MRSLFNISSGIKVNFYFEERLRREVFRFIFLFDVRKLVDFECYRLKNQYTSIQFEMIDPSEYTLKVQTFTFYTVDAILTIVKLLINQEGLLGRDFMGLQ